MFVYVVTVFVEDLKLGNTSFKFEMDEGDIKSHPEAGLQVIEDVMVFIWLLKQPHRNELPGTLVHVSTTS